MKASNKTLLCAIGLLILSLTVYDVKLNSEYKKRNYTKPFGNYEPTDFKDFDEIVLESGTAINLKVVKGPYKVSIDPSATDMVQIKKEGKKLIISAVFSDHYRSIYNPYVVLVSCPDIKKFSSDSRYRQGNENITDSLAKDLNWKPTLITGFTTDSLDITGLHASNIQLENNRIGNLKAILGADRNTGAGLTIGRGNSIRSASYDVRNYSTLAIQSTAGSDMVYKIADSARLIVSGAISKQLFKKNSHEINH